MGLQNQLTDFSSDSIPLYFLAIVINFICYIRSLIFSLIHSLNVIHVQPNEPNDAVLFESVGKGLAGIIILADQLKLNRVFSYKFRLSDMGTMNTDCVVCLNVFADGEHVRKLACRHVFHKECFDGWLDQMNFRCPLCRSPVVCDERVRSTRRRVADDVMEWFSVR